VNDKGPSILIGGAILAFVLIIGGLIYLYATSEILLEHGTVTSKEYVPPYHGSHIEFHTDSDGNTTFRTVDDSRPAQYNVTIMGGRKTFNLNDRNVFNRFPQGARVKVTYLSKLGWVKRVYGEDEQIPVEGQ